MAWQLIALLVFLVLCLGAAAWARIDTQREIRRAGNNPFYLRPQPWPDWQDWPYTIGVLLLALVGIVCWPLRRILGL